MSTIDIDAGGKSGASGRSGLRSRPWPPLAILALAIVAAAGLGQFMAAKQWLAVWSTGAFFDTDDAMRAVQVRDFLAGQNWFDLTAHRLDPADGGVFMHWSRIVDVPLALLVRGAEWVTDPVTAERVARLLFPFLLTLAVFAELIWLAERLLGRAVRVPALAAAFLYGPAAGQFAPGRIDHHAPQIVLLLLCVGALCATLLARRTGPAVLAGAAIPLSLGISVENEPFFVALFAALFGVWIAEGQKRAPVLQSFALGMALSLPPVYLATVPPARWFLAVSDALSLAQACAVLAAAALFVIVTIVPLQLRNTWRERALVGLACAILAAAGLRIFFPQLFGDPFAALDPVLRTLWLDGVDEAQPLGRKLLADPFWTVGALMPALLGLAGAVYRCCTENNSGRQAAWFLLAVTACGGLLASCLMIRTMSAVVAVVVPGALAGAVTLLDRVKGHPVTRGPLAMLLLLLAGSSVGWSAAAHAIGQVVPSWRALSTLPRAPAANAPAAGSECLAPRAFADLARSPMGLVLAEPDLGSYLLAHTPHSVLAGAYHRNTRGMRVALEAFAAEPAAAEAMVRAEGVTYIAYCRTEADIQRAETAPHGLAAALAAGHIPSWLRQRDASGSLTVFDVK